MILSFYPSVKRALVTVNFEKSLNLEELCCKYNMIYEPEQFPGAIFRVNEPDKATVLLFATGKAVIAGLKNSRQIKMTLRKLARIVKTVDDT